MREDSTIVDLKVAYLQIHLVRKLWKYQLVQFKGNTYFLTHLEFGLNVVPKVMATVLESARKDG